MSSQYYIIPDLLATWPWKRILNPFLDEVRDEANAWVKSQDLFEPAQLQRFFYACDSNLMAALYAPLANKERLQITCDLMGFGYVYDEYTDVANKLEATKIANSVMDAFRRRKDNIHPSHNKIATMAQEFIQRTVSVVGENAPGLERFISDYDAYTKAVILEAEDRMTGRVRTVNDYIIFRRYTSGGKWVFSFLGLGLDIPNVVFEHPLMISLIEDCVDLATITNDMHSYSRERSRGLAGHNIITVIMREYHLDLQETLYWISGYTSRIISNFLSNNRALPSWGEEIDQAVKEYIDRMAQCVRGNDCWSFECYRYYGRDGLKVQESRRATLLPPDSAFDITREQLGLENLVVG